MDYTRIELTASDTDITKPPSRCPLANCSWNCLLKGVSSLGEIRQGAPVGDFLIFVNSSSYSSFIFSCSFPCPEELLCFMYPRDSEMNRGAEGSPGKKKPVVARHQPIVTNGLGCLSRWPSHFTKEWLNGFSASWESISLWKKVTLPWESNPGRSGNHSSELLG